MINSDNEKELYVVGTKLSTVFSVLSVALWVLFSLVIKDSMVFIIFIVSFILFSLIYSLLEIWTDIYSNERDINCKVLSLFRFFLTLSLFFISTEMNICIFISSSISFIFLYCLIIQTVFLETGVYVKMIDNKKGSSFWSQNASLIKLYKTPEVDELFVKYFPSVDNIMDNYKYEEILLIDSAYRKRFYKFQGDVALRELLIALNIEFDEADFINTQEKTKEETHKTNHKLTEASQADFEEDLVRDFSIGGKEIDLMRKNISLVSDLEKIIGAQPNAYQKLEAIEDLIKALDSMPSSLSDSIVAKRQELIDLINSLSKDLLREYETEYLRILDNKISDSTELFKKGGN